MSELTNALITYDDVIAKTNIDVLRKIAKVHDFAIFDKGNYNLNIWGIRCNTADTGTFNDLLLVFYKANDANPKMNGKWIYDWFSITTDPSDLNLIKPINSKGCAILKEGQFRGAFKDLHKAASYSPCLRRIAILRLSSKVYVITVSLETFNSLPYISSDAIIRNNINIREVLNICFIFNYSFICISFETIYKTFLFYSVILQSRNNPTKRIQSMIRNISCRYSFFFITLNNISKT